MKHRIVYIRGLFQTLNLRPDEKNLDGLMKCIDK